MATDKNKTFKFFKDSGIQFFTIPDAILSYTDKIHEKFEDDYALFTKKWFPLSLDGSRNILMFKLLSTGDKPGVVFSIDTNLSNGDRNEADFHGIHADDQELKFHYDLSDPKRLEEFAQNPDQDYISKYLEKKIPIADITKNYLESISKDIENKKINYESEQLNLTELNDLIALYRHFVYSLIQKADFSIIMLSANSGVHQTYTDVALVLDLGNTRSIGLLLEKDDKKRPQLNNVQPLWMLDFNKLTGEDGHEYLESYSDEKFNDYLIPSRIIFKKHPFYDFHYDSEHQTRYKTFNYPSVVAFGKEAQTTYIDEELDRSAVGLSGPKRYLWSTEERKVKYWRFSDGTKLKSKIFKYIKYDQNDFYGIDKNFDKYETPPRAVHSKSTMMLFAMMEIIYQAYCQINSLHYREQAGDKDKLRQLNDIYLSFPTGMPTWERNLLKKRAETALDILIRMDAIKIQHEEAEQFYHLRRDYLDNKDSNSNKGENLASIYKEYEKNKNKLYPKVSLGFDEAACSQIAFLYGQSHILKNNMKLFYELFSDSNNNSVRVASLDIGGGTTDLSINDFLLENVGGSNLTLLDKKHVFSDGFNSAGDDIIKSIIEKVIIPDFIKTQTTKKLKENATNILIGALDKGNIAPAKISQRIALINDIFLPIAYFYLYILENKDDPIIEGEIAKIANWSSLRNFLEDINYPPIQYDNKILGTEDTNIALEWLGGTEKELKDRTAKDVITTTRLEKLLFNPQPNFKKLEESIEEVLSPIFIDYARVLNQFSPSFLLISGKISTIPFIKNLFTKYLPVSPDRIVSLNNYPIGNWYPRQFKDIKGNIKDPKTTVVAGNLIGYVSEKCNSDTFRFKETKNEEIAPFEINYMEQIIENAPPSLFYDKGENINDEVTMINEFNVSHKKINFKQSKKRVINIIYNVSFSNPNAKSSISGDELIRIQFDCENPSENIKILKISGKVDLEGNGNYTEVKPEDIHIKKQTLMEKDYYLDNPSFEIMEL